MSDIAEMASFWTRLGEARQRLDRFTEKVVEARFQTTVVVEVLRALQVRHEVQGQP